MDVGPNRDLVGDLTNSVRTAGLHMGLYHSLREWYHPLYEMDNKDNCSGTLFPDQVLLPTLKEMVEQYKVGFNLQHGSLHLHIIYCNDHIIYMYNRFSMVTQNDKR